MTRSQPPLPAQEFALGDVLSITTGVLLSRDGMDGVYRILNFMTGDDLQTVSLVFAARECRPVLFDQHPWLRDVTVPKLNGTEEAFAWLDSMEVEHGATLTVTVLRNYVQRDPIQDVLDILRDA